MGERNRNTGYCKLMVIAPLFQISVMNYFRMRNQRKSSLITSMKVKLMNKILMVRRILIIVPGGAYAVDLKAYRGEKLKSQPFSNVYKNRQIIK